MYYNLFGNDWWLLLRILLCLVEVIVAEMEMMMIADSETAKLVKELRN